jgi:hypothetical protein
MYVDICIKNKKNFVLTKELSVGMIKWKSRNELNFTLIKSLYK